MASGGGVATVPAIIVSQTRKGSAPFINHSELPSAHCKYDVWHELKDNEIYAKELKNPRVRKGPSQTDRSSDSDSSSSSDSDVESATEKKPKSAGKWWKIKNYRDSHENWKEATLVNLSYQNLGDDYQRHDFMKVLKVLKSCEELHIGCNELRDISSVSLPVCRNLNMTSNHVSTFNDLPKASKLEHLNMTENDISNVDGLERFKRLKTLDLVRNPVSYTFDYRAHVFSKLPQLQVLDGIPKMESDENFEYPQTNNSCVVS